MQLSCNKCHHQWNEDLSGSTAMVQCPECFAVVPLVLAKTAAPAAAEAPTVAAKKVTHEDQTVISPEDTDPLSSFRNKTPPGTRTRSPDIHEMPTMIETGGGRLGSRDGRKRLSEQFHSHASDLMTPPKTKSLEEEIEASMPEFDTDSIRQVTETQPALPPEKADKPEKQPKSRNATPAGSKPFATASPKELDLSGETIGGYEVKQMLGAGGMGAVCLARQISLDRDVALKILPGRFASNPDFLVRFTREALSAAQLTHHNVIQVYDVGSDKDVHYISMEYVRGESLAEMVRRDGPLPADTAASYVLQAARGLKYAHERGIVHRDVKPDNLMLNEHGIIKVADMGLAKMTGNGKAETKKAGDLNPQLARARGDLTLQDIAMGTPSYMAPEQARDASTVDFRADQYSLGCTLYYLCAGKPPYSGTTAMEIITKHMEAPPPSLEGQARIPGGFDVVLSRMLAKIPQERYPHLGEVIDDLEALLGVEGEKGTYTPREEHLAVLVKSQAEYYDAPLRGTQKLVVAMFFITCAALFAATAVLRMPYASGTMLGLLILTPALNFIVGGLINKSYLFRRVRSAFFGMTLAGWARTVAGALVIAGVLYGLGLLPYWIAAALIGSGLVALYQTRIVRPLQAQRGEPLEATRMMLRQLRMRGLSEEALMDFVCRLSGPDWEEMFEDLFGYENMIMAREKWAASDHLTARKRRATWREPIARWLQSVEEQRKASREKRELARVEAKRLKAEGLSEASAQEKAERMAAKTYADMKVCMQIADEVDHVRHSTKVEKQLWDLALQGLRLVVGLAVVFFFVGVVRSGWIPAPIMKLHAWLSHLPIPPGLRAILTSWYGAAAGAALLVSAFSWRRIATSFVLIGSALVLAGWYVVPMIEGRTEVLSVARYYYASLALAAFGLVICISAKLSGRRF